MSKIRVDEIVNKTDDGSPSFPQGATSIEPTMDNHVATKSYVDGIMASDFGSSVSISAPSNPVIGSFWTDTSSDPNILKIWNGSNWVAFAGTVDNVSSEIGLGTPTILTPTYDEQDVNSASLGLTSTAPESFIVGREQTSSSVATWGTAQWEIAMDDQFTLQSQTLTSPLTSTGTQSGPTGFNVGFGNRYYVRTRYTSAYPAGTTSNWSPTSTFKTAAFVDYYWLSVFGGYYADYAGKIAVNSTNQYIPTIYTTGWSNSATANDNDAYLTKFNSMGDIQWRRRFRSSNGYHDKGHGVATDSSDNVYMCGESSSEAFLVKYNGSGVLQWQRGISGTGDMRLKSAKTDSSGNVYVVGQAHGDFLIAKYDSYGNILWSRTYDNVDINSSTGSYGNDIALDDSGNIYITGNAYVATGSGTAAGDPSEGRSEEFGIFTMKFDSSGNIVWQRRIRVHKRHNYANGITVDSSGNVYVTGRVSATRTNGDDLLVAKYNNAGSLSWYTTIEGPYNVTGAAVVVDDSGDVFVTATGHLGASPRILNENVVLKFNSSGVYEEAYRFGGQQHEYASAIALDGMQNLYVYGYQQSDIQKGGNTDLALIKVPGDGSQTGTWSSSVGSLQYNDVTSLLTVSSTSIIEEEAMHTESSKTVNSYESSYFDSEFTQISANTTILNP